LDVNKGWKREGNSRTNRFGVGKMNADNPRIRGSHVGTLVLTATAIVEIVVCVLLAEPFLGAIT